MFKGKITVLASVMVLLTISTSVSPRLTWSAPEHNGQTSVLGETHAQYMAYQQYRDEGTLTITHFENNEVVRKSIVSFSTHFDRSGEFQIDWQDQLRTGEEGLSYRIWTEGGIAFSRYGLDTPFQSPSLRDALSRAVGISNSLTYYIPCMLLPDMHCQICDKENPVRVEIPPEADEESNRIELHHQSGKTETFWIERTTNRITGIEWWRQTDSQTVHHQIAFSSIETDQ